MGVFDNQLYTLVVFPRDIISQRVIFGRILFFACRYKTDNYATAFYTNEFIQSTANLNRKKFLGFSLTDMYQLSKIQPNVV